MSTRTRAVRRPPETTAPVAVVAVVLCWRGRVGLFKRSALVGYDAGRWHCVTGYLDPGRTPREQALLELTEETGLRADDLVSLGPDVVLDLIGDAPTTWRVHVFLAHTERRRLTLDWEHDAYRWVRPEAVSGFENRVGWLDDVVSVAGVPNPSRPSSNP